METEIQIQQVRDERAQWQSNDAWVGAQIAIWKLWGERGEYSSKRRPRGNLEGHWPGVVTSCSTQRATAHDELDIM